MKTYILLLLIVLAIILFIGNLFIGTVSIPLDAILRILLDMPIDDYAADDVGIWRNIICNSRMPQTLTATLAGAGLSVNGLQMQTVFRNPLAGPSVLGVSNGASLGVAFVVLLSSSIGSIALSRLGYVGDVAMTISAIIGSLGVLALIIMAAQHVRGNHSPCPHGSDSQLRPFGSRRHGLLWSNNVCGACRSTSCPWTFPHERPSLAYAHDISMRDSADAFLRHSVPPAGV